MSNVSEAKYGKYTMRELQGFNRHHRRAIAAEYGLPKIVGTNEPIVKHN